jgi:hypothetical protein
MMESVTAQEVIDEMRYTIPLRVASGLMVPGTGRAAFTLRRAMEFIRDNREVFDEWSKRQQP